MNRLRPERIGEEWTASSRKREQLNWMVGMRENGRRIITCIDDISEGLEFISSVEPRFAHAAKVCGDPPLRSRNEGFTALLDMIVSQQLSVASADAIWGRMKAADLVSRDRVLSASDGDLQVCGLSRPKIKYARALAASEIDFGRLVEQTDEEVVLLLTSVKGIGRWTAEIYMMFSLGRADVIAAGDLALQESTKLLFALDARPTEDELRRMAERWRPWRAVAARLLWRYYRFAKKREGVR